MRKNIFTLLAGLALLCSCEEIPEYGGFFSEVPGTTVKESALSKKKYNLAEYYGNEYVRSGVYNCCMVKNKIFYLQVSEETIYEDGWDEYKTSIDNYNILSHLDGTGAEYVQFEEDFVQLRKHPTYPSTEDYITQHKYTFKDSYIETEIPILRYAESGKAKLLYIDSDYLILQDDNAVEEHGFPYAQHATFSLYVYVTK